MSNYIQSISYAKLAKYDQTRIDLSIRKYVLITNLLREEQRQQQQSNYNEEDEDMILLEQHWFESCLNELDKEEEQEEKIEQAIKPNLHLKAFYNFSNGKGFLFCTSSL